MFGTQGFAVKEIWRPQRQKIRRCGREARAPRTLEALAIDGFKTRPQQGYTDDRDRRSALHGTLG